MKDDSLKKQKTIYFLIGNGFSINIVKKIGKDTEIDLTNLFSMGDKVFWPDNDKECFLSKKHCPNLWELGAKTTATKEESTRLIGNIITSMNAHSLYLDDGKRIKAVKDTSYYKAYCQLVSYLKNLFIYYNTRITDDDFKSLLDKGKKYHFVSFVQSQLKKGNKVRIITYNYDVLLERMLTYSKIPYKIAGFDSIENDDPLVIFKPHGSISFETKAKRMPGQSYNNMRDPFDGIKTSLTDMALNIDIKCDNSIVNPLIPPAGDANRMTDGWVKELNNEIEKCIDNAGDDDELIIYGISYDHVDRNELDKIVTMLPYCINVQYINPYPSDTFEMVLASIFENYSHYKDFYWEE